MELEDGKIDIRRIVEGYEGHTLTAADSAPDITQTLTGRRVHMPPPRQTTPRHTNIGSPKRMSSARPTSRSAAADASSSQPLTNAPANRRLDFQATNRNRKSVNVVDGSPFKPKKVLRRSDGPARRSIYEQVDDEEDEPAHEPANAGLDDDSIEHSIEDNGPMMMEDDVHGVEDDQSAISVSETQAPAKRKPGRPRKSDLSNTSIIQHTPPVAHMGSASKKRPRSSLNDTQGSISQPQVEASGSRSKKSRISNVGSISVHRDSYSGNDDVNPIDVEDYLEEVQDDDVEVDAQLDSQLQEEPEEEPQPQPKGKGRPKGKGKKAASAPKERDANRAMPKKGSPVKLNDSPSKRHRGGSAGPVSNVQLRATTPFDDAHQTTSRAGRNLIQPLKFWQNESLIWKGGEIEGVIRADPVEQSRPTTKRRRKGKKSKRSKLNAIEEESDTESILPDEWEEEMGVITGNIAAWNPLTKTADPGDPIQEGMLQSWYTLRNAADPEN